jgi:hypothetical protein
VIDLIGGAEGNRTLTSAVRLQVSEKLAPQKRISESVRELGKVCSWMLFDLRLDEDTFDPLAPFKVLAVLCHPRDRSARERMLAHVHAGTGVGRPRRRALDRDEFHSEVRQNALRAGVAGSLLLTRLQLHHLGNYSPLRDGVTQA